MGNDTPAKINTVPVKLEEQKNIDELSDSINFNKSFELALKWLDLNDLGDTDTKMQMAFKSALSWLWEVWKNPEKINTYTSFKNPFDNITNLAELDNTRESLLETEKGKVGDWIRKLNSYVV